MMPMDNDSFGAVRFTKNYSNSMWCDFRKKWIFLSCTLFFILITLFFIPYFCHHSSLPPVVYKSENENRSEEGTEEADISLLEMNSPIISSTLPEAVRLSGIIDLVLVPETDTWLVAGINPVVSKLRNMNMNPILLAVSETSEQNAIKLLKHIVNSNRALVIATTQEKDTAFNLRDFSYLFLSTGSDPANAGIVLMKKFWESPEEVVIASIEEPKYVILGSTLAAIRSIPFISWQGEDDFITLFQNLSDFGVGKVFLCTDLSGNKAKIVDESPPTLTFLDHEQIIRAIIEKISPDKIDNMIIAREPSIAGEFSSSWIAPYYSILRNALVLISETDDPSVIEDFAFGTMEKFSLNPRTITLLGDCEAIGEWVFQDTKIYDDEMINIEPCSLDMENEAAVFGVGRIPFNRLGEASNLITRVELYERLSAEGPPSVLIIANPDSEFAGLPLCETITRLTAEEFKNHSISVNEFYGREAKDTRLLNLAENAHLILFEGHVYDFTLFDSHPDDLDIQEDDPNIRNIELEVQEDYFDIQEAIKKYDYNNSLRNILCELEPEASIIPTLTDKNLENHPLIILQSCHSLADEIPDPIFNRGASGILGTVSNVHSASGAAFIKAFCDNLLYQGNTLGEALRDARNYFFCLAKLKEKRGHLEQAKVYRVAHSFRLWGDPEMRLGFHKAAKLRRLPVSARWVNFREIGIFTPHRKLPRVETDYYFAGIFPGSQVAGLVKSLKNNPDQRKMMPLQFFRLPLAGEPGFYENALLETPCGDPTRAVFLKDPLNRFLYILYFPLKTFQDSTTILRIERSDG